MFFFTRLTFTNKSFEFILLLRESKNISIGKLLRVSWSRNSQKTALKTSKVPLAWRNSVLLITHLLSSGSLVRNHQIVVFFIQTTLVRSEIPACLRRLVIYKLDLTERNSGGLKQVAEIVIFQLCGPFLTTFKLQGYRSDLTMRFFPSSSKHHTYITYFECIAYFKCPPIFID